MQKQIDMLANSHTPHSYYHEQDDYTSSETRNHAMTHVRPAKSHQRLRYPTFAKDNAVFCGATSTEYTLNMVERNIVAQRISADQNNKMPHSPIPATKHSLYFAEKQPRHDDVSSSVENQQTNKASQASSACLCEDCTRALRMLTKEEALRLVEIYEEVVGHLHPFFNQEWFRLQVEAAYTAIESHEAEVAHQCKVDSDTLDNIKVALAIPLLALGIGSSDIGTSLYASVQDKVHSAVFAPIKSVKKIVLLLLAVRLQFQTAVHF